MQFPDRHLSERVVNLDLALFNPEPMVIIGRLERIEEEKCLYITILKAIT